MSEVTFGFTLTRDGVTLGEIRSFTPPKISQGSVEKTHHGSTFLGVAWREFIPDGLLQAESFSVMVAATPAQLAIIAADMANKTTEEYVIGFPGDFDPWGFDAFPMSISAPQADPESPDLLEFEIEFQPTGELAPTIFDFVSA
jgi:hypothetical protein